MEVIDAHCHVHSPKWVKKESENDFLIKNFDVCSLETEIIQNMQEAKVNKTIIFPMPSIFVNLEAANLYVTYLAKLYPHYFIPFAIIDINSQKWIDLGVKGFKEHTFGLRIQKDKYGNDIFSHKFKQSYKIMEGYGLPLLLHAGKNIVERIKYDILKSTPLLKIIIAHLGADFPETNKFQPLKEQVINILKQLKNIANIYYDISAIHNTDLIKYALDIIGTEKIVFGSDFPYEKPLTVLTRLQSLKLTREEMRNICYLNIERVLPD
jgi:predicted TIM-barrel fold metal-dependent hydrolase